MNYHCDTCTYWQKHTGVDAGICRRYAPQAVPLLVPKASQMAVSELQLQMVWPSTGAKDGCGDYMPQPKENT
jgi:hypothetical protein